MNNTEGVFHISSGVSLIDSRLKLNKHEPFGNYMGQLSWENSENKKNVLLIDVEQSQVSFSFTLNRWISWSFTIWIFCNIRYPNIAAMESQRLSLSNSNSPVRLSPLQFISGSTESWEILSALCYRRWDSWSQVQIHEALNLQQRSQLLSSWLVSFTLAA